MNIIHIPVYLQIHWQIPKCLWKGYLFHGDFNCSCCSRVPLAVLKLRLIYCGLWIGFPQSTLWAIQSSGFLLLLFVGFARSVSYCSYMRWCLKGFYNMEAWNSSVYCSSGMILNCFIHVMIMEIFQGIINEFNVLCSTFENICKSCCLLFQNYGHPLVSQLPTVLHLAIQ